MRSDASRVPGRSSTEPDGAAARVEHALRAALAGIDAIYAIEEVNAYNADVASPVDVHEFWEKHGQLPGFAART